MKKTVILSLHTILATSTASWMLSGHKQTIRIDMLHSLTDIMVMRTKPLVDTLRLATKELNADESMNKHPMEKLISVGKFDVHVFTDLMLYTPQHESLKCKQSPNIYCSDKWSLGSEDNRGKSSHSPRLM